MPFARACGGREGPKAFCAGYDITAIPAGGSGEAEEAEGFIRRCMESRDLAEGKKAFLEKRKPTFTGR